MRKLYENQLIQLAKESGKMLTSEDLKYLDAQALLHEINSYLSMYNCLCFTPQEIDLLAVIIEVASGVKALPHEPYKPPSISHKRLHQKTTRANRNEIKTPARLAYFLNKRNETAITCSDS